MVFFLGLACLTGGFLIILPLFMEKYQGLKRFDEKIKPYKIIIGLAILIIGAIKFFAPYHGGDKQFIIIIGDLLPAVLAILVGILISVDFLESLQGAKKEDAASRAGAKKLESFWTRTKSVLQRYQHPIGFASMLFGLLHWFIFKVPFF